MITITVSDKAPLKIKSRLYVFILEENFSISSDVQELGKTHGVDIKAVLKEMEFAGKAKQIQVVPLYDEKTVTYAVFAGVGKADKKAIDIEQYRRAIGRVTRKVVSHKCESFVLQAPQAQIFGVNVHELARQTAIILNMAAYHFDEFITDADRKECKVFDVTICVKKQELADFQQGVHEGEIIAQAVNKARHWIDLPANCLTPPHLADKAIDIAKKHKLDITVFNEEQINKMGMGGLAAVSRGSDLECRLAIMEYKTKKKGAPTVAFVGKGITFDSGGLSIKPASNMETMKEDMSGAAAVITTMEALAQLKPDINVIGITPLSENLPSGKATKPGDIVRFYNGKTAEIKNTDAEGRLILADALSYAVKHYKPDAIIDVATLTGSCAYALGPFFTGIFSEHDEMVDRVTHASKTSGDRVWRMPMDADYRPAIKSEVADLCNIGQSRYMAGAVTAAHFLQNFVGDTPWLHCDIAGTAFDVPDLPYYRPGATGAGVRLLIDLAMSWKK